MNIEDIGYLLGGGFGGTAGAVLTCPFEVVKTRLQSSVATFDTQSGKGAAPKSGADNQVIKKLFPLASSQNVSSRSGVVACSSCAKLAATKPAAKWNASSIKGPELYQCLRYIVKHEGYPGLFKGLGPNLVGVFPSRAVYFLAYNKVKTILNETEGIDPDTWKVHICSGAAAGFTASTLTNPIWYIKTRLQLDQKRSKARLTVWKCIKDTYKDRGIPGFYRGITASYYGIVETAIHFVIYEHIKSVLHERKKLAGMNEEEGVFFRFFDYMGAGAISKSCATCIAYPHEVARTRLRQEGNVYRHFWQTLFLVFRQEGVAGLYRGLATQLVRQIPNTAIMMGVYELFMHGWTMYVIDDGETTHDY